MDLIYVMYVFFAMADPAEGLTAETIVSVSGFDTLAACEVALEQALIDLEDEGYSNFGALCSEDVQED